MPEWSNGTDSKSVESAMAPRVQIPISPPLHMSKAPGMPGVPGALSGERSGVPLRAGEKAVPWFRVLARSCSSPRNAAGPSFVLSFLLLWAVVPLCLGFVGALSAHFSMLPIFCPSSAGSGDLPVSMVGAVLLSIPALEGAADVAELHGTVSFQRTARLSVCAESRSRGWGGRNATARFRRLRLFQYLEVSGRGDCQHLRAGLSQSRVDRGG